MVEIMDIQTITAGMKADSYKMAALSLETRNNILKNVKEALLENKEAGGDIFQKKKRDFTRSFFMQIFSLPKFPSQCSPHSIKAALSKELPQANPVLPVPLPKGKHNRQ